MAALGSLELPKARLDTGDWSSLGWGEVSLPWQGAGICDIPKNHRRGRSQAALSDLFQPQESWGSPLKSLHFTQVTLSHTLLRNKKHFLPNLAPEPGGGGGDVTVLFLVGNGKLGFIWVV